MLPITASASSTDVATELETNLSIRVVGGERAVVTSVRNVTLETGSFDWRGNYKGVASWSVDALSSHWGHDHRRQVDYRAQMEINPEDGNWKLAAVTVLEANAPDV